MFCWEAIEKICLLNTSFVRYVLQRKYLRQIKVDKDIWAGDIACIHLQYLALIPKHFHTQLFLLAAGLFIEIRILDNPSHQSDTCICRSVQTSASCRSLSVKACYGVLYHDNKHCSSYWHQQDSIIILLPRLESLSAKLYFVTTLLISMWDSCTYLMELLYRSAVTCPRTPQHEKTGILNKSQCTNDYE